MWLHSSIGRASHRYRGGHGFESRWSPDFFRLLLSNCLNWKINCDDHSSLSVYLILYNLQFGYKIWKKVLGTRLINKITFYFEKKCRKKMQSTKPFHTISSGVVSGWSSTTRRSASLISCPVKVVIAILNKSTHGCIEVAIKG